MNERALLKSMLNPGIIHLFILYVVWGSTYLAMRVAVSGTHGFAPFTMGALRVLMAGIILLIWAAVRRHPVRLTRRDAWVLAITAACLWLGGNGLVLWAEQYADSGYSALMVGTVPLWTALLESILDRKLPTPILVASLLAGFAGIALLNASALAHGDESRWYASLVLIVAPVSWAIGTIVQKRHPLSISSPLVVSGYQQLFAGLGFAAVAALLGEPWGTPSHQAWMALAYLIIFGSVLAFTSFGVALRLLPASVVLTYAYVNPVIALFLGWALLGEPIGIWNLTGAALILLSVAGVFRANRKASTPRQSAPPHEESAPTAT
ncbi:MAG: EamA family transporter [Alicyclobacillus macrosporangiidus]|uniref:EamA family transporter n=1 Tax=Alicyclobacillus macrosporangiidus TaxID=392015 RepID=UPI0026F15582|nr:EamA family transporter [Alicyclobacillus macrosporangiidus]MCL6600664.1 EamA family transporter [Alicyclobacillus macrosporangiidus]